MRVMVELELPKSAITPFGERRRTRALDVAGEIASAINVELDSDYAPTRLSLRSTRSARERVDMRVIAGGIRQAIEGRRETWIVRGRLDDPEKVAYLAGEHPSTIGVYADMPVVPFAHVCMNSNAVGSFDAVRGLLQLEVLHDDGFTGKGVKLAVVDTGFSADELRAAGAAPTVKQEPHYSWQPDVGPGEHGGRLHGSMCAFLASSVAPAAELIDLVFLAPLGNSLESLTSDALVCFNKLRDERQSAEDRRAPLVVCNSWGVEDPSGDAPVGSDQRYIDNPEHVMTLAVADLATTGADIVFAAGNCGPACSTDGCQFPDQRTICGANSARDVLCVGAVTVDGQVPGYSAAGPGLVVADKPDVLCYSHFAGFYKPDPDAGTSAAAPLAAGLIAALRTRWNPDVLPPGMLRELMRLTAAQPAAGGADHQCGRGVLQTEQMFAAVRRAVAD